MQRPVKSLRIQITLNTLLSAIAKELEIELDEIASSRRDRIYVAARMFFCHLAHQKFRGKVSYSQLGGYINRDHSTAIHYIRTLQESGVRNWFPEHFKVYEKLHETFIMSDDEINIEERRVGNYFENYLLRFAQQHVKWTNQVDKLVFQYIKDNPIIIE